MKRLVVFCFLLSNVLIVFADINVNNELFDAIRSESPNRVEGLLLDEDNPADPNAQQEGKTAIMVAIENIKGRRGINVLEHLLDQAAKTPGTLDFIADNGMTALTFAAELGNADLVNTIIGYGAKAKVPNRFGKTADYYINLNQKAREKERADREYQRFEEEFEVIENPKEEPWNIIDINE